MYITQELFGSAHSHVYAHNWNSMADAQSSNSGLGKRKRRFDADDEGPSSRPRQFEDGAVGDVTRYHITANQFTSSPHGTRVVHRLPSDTASTPYRSTDQRPLKQLRLVSPRKASLQKQPSFQMDIEIEEDGPPRSTTTTNPQTQPVSSSSSSNPDLRACHICSKAPKRKSDMINYLDCSRCVGRTCFICARDCAQCHKSLCRDCCTEVGEEGDAWCLACYERSVNT